MADKKPTPKSVAKAVERKTVEPIEVDEIIEVPEAEVEAIEEVVEVPEVVEEVVEVTPEPVLAPKADVPPTTYAVVGGGAVDPVHLSKCVFKSTTHKRSLTVHHLQRRLNEWGFVDAYLDKDGYFGDLTLKSVNEFRAMRGIVSDLAIDAETFSAIFEGDSNVSVVID